MDIMKILIIIRLISLVSGKLSQCKCLNSIHFTDKNYVKRKEIEQYLPGYNS